MDMNKKRERLTVTVEECAALLGISRASAYQGIERNEIPHIRIGRRIIISRIALDKLLHGSIRRANEEEATRSTG